VFRKDNRDAPLLVEATEQPDEFVASDRVELRGRLVEENQLRAGNKGSGKGHALQLAARERVGCARQ